jgi:hypothetical protein
MGVGIFQAPSNVSDTVAYDIYLRSDSDGVYALLESKPAGAAFDKYSAGLNFSNLYFSTNYPNGSTVAFEVTNSRACNPNNCAYKDLSTTGYQFKVTQGTDYAQGGAADQIETYIPWDFFVNDPTGIGFNKISATNPTLQLRLSQTFGYGAVGGMSTGPGRLGIVTYSPTATPEPGTLSLFAVGGLITWGIRARRKRLQKA